VAFDEIKDHGFLAVLVVVHQIAMELLLKSKNLFQNHAGPSIVTISITFRAALQVESGGWW
jgi:hypothetical protein